MKDRHSQHGALTLVPMPGFEDIATLLKEQIERKETPVDIASPIFGRRSSKEPFIKLKKKHIGGHDCVILTSGPGTPDMLVNLFFLLNHVAGRRAARITVITAYFPLSRSDRDEADDEFALPPLIVSLMKTAAQGRLDRIISVDLHASQVVMAGDPGLITEVSMFKRVFKQALEEALQTHDKIVVHYPDNGAKKRYEEAVTNVADELDCDIFTTFGDKRRGNSRDVEIKDIYRDVDELEGALVLSVDDEAATVSTNLRTANTVRERAEIHEFWAIVTHAILCGDAVENLQLDHSPLDRLYVADTVPLVNRQFLNPFVKSGKIRVVSWLTDLGHIIYHHHWDTSIRTTR
ncbi:hypothetical protein C0581_05020 [Candidatus Parcubacteria bacterium]|nr:MAG: hypothetical protein C0581_05020 [Candidatus Parcubacteria bacterium]